MEILNNIWLALSTENETIINVITFFGNIIETTLSMLLFSCILKIQFSIKRAITYILLTSCLGFISKLILIAPFNIIFNLIILFLCIKIIFKLNVFKSLIAEFAPYIILILLELIVVNFFSSIIKIDTNYFMTIPIYKILVLATVYMFLFLIYALLNKFNLSFNFLDNLNKNNKLVLIFNFILGIISILTQSYLTTFYGSNFPPYIIFLSFISLLTYFFISIYSLYKANKLEYTTQELESAEAYNKTLTVLHDNVSCFKHDFDNIVATIGGYVKTDDMKGLKKYYYDLEKDCQYLNDLSALNPTVINNNGVYNLLTSKYSKATKLNVEMHLEFFLDLNTLHMKIYDFSRVLGILIDNAIEAASECEEKIVNLKFRNEESRNRHLVIIENTYKNKDVDTEEIFSKGLSSKKEHSGLGLWEINKTLNKYNNLSLYTTKSDNLFTQQLEIYY